MVCGRLAALVAALRGPLNEGRTSKALTGTPFGVTAKHLASDLADSLGSYILCSHVFWGPFSVHYMVAVFLSAKVDQTKAERGATCIPR